MNSGVIYYKLETGYPGDITKNCGLTGNEIDSNFNFLRGYDIESGIYDPETNKLTLKRFNNEDIVIDMDLSGSELFPEYTFSFDNKEGVLVITKPDGSEERVSGFTVDSMTEFSVDNTLLGNGKPNNPIRLNPIERTGTLAPANSYIDLTMPGNLLPEPSKGYRIVTKERLNIFGRLYDYNSVQNIDTALAEEGNGWRVPTKEDFDELFDAVECDGFKNHSATTLGFFGKTAGQTVKSNILWKNVNVGVETDDVNGLDTIGMSILPCGWGGINNIQTDEFGETASLWTNTNYDNETIYVKNLHYNSNQIEQHISTKDSFRSIRLVKDYDKNNFSEIERILGDSYPTVLVRIPESNYIKIWTKINFFGERLDINWKNVNANVEDIEKLDTVYYINEWDGTQWVKKQLNEGDSIVILEKDNTEYREWRLKNGILHDIFGEDFNSELANLHDSIDNISERVSDLTTNVMNTLSGINETIAVQDTIMSEMTTNINNLSAHVYTVIANELDTLREEMQEYTNNAINNLQQNIQNNIADTIKTTIKNYLRGAANEISITRENLGTPNEKLVIGFADNAIFGSY